MIDLTNISPETNALLLAGVTAAATVVLGILTAVLAKETRRLANASSQPQVVASILPNRSGGPFADLHVQNTGNATAYNVLVQFEPPLEVDKIEPDDPVPLGNISLLKPGQVLTSFVNSFENIGMVDYTVKVSWQKRPDVLKRETLQYSLRIADIRGVNHLGETDPVMRMSMDIKKIQEDIRQIARGSRKTKVDVFTSADREKDVEKALLHRSKQRKGSNKEEI